MELDSERELRTIGFSGSCLKMSVNSQKVKVLKVNFGCFNSNIEGWIGVDHVLRHIIVSKLDFCHFI